MDIPLVAVIVTGGCGFIGSHIIHVIDIDTGRNRFAGASYHTCDISVPSDVCTVFAEAKPKTVFHVACPDSSVKQSAVFRRVNLGTVQAFVNTTTSSTLPVLQYPAQKRVYTLTNAVAEADIPVANRESGDASMLTVSLRPSSTFGERDTVIMGKIAPLVQAYGEPSPNPEMRVDGEVFNATNEERVNFWSFQQSIAASVGLPVRKEDIIILPVWIAMATADVSEKPSVTREAIHLTTINRTSSNATARRVLRYKPRVSVDSGLAKAGKWYIEEAQKAESRKVA
ncbi:C-3 sterol dehydrogenase/C-4 decarboxylase family protein [Xylaria arbuscula]|nr:C-3 sterol dehydrogenase/C-4 decarboxylase family protein [Xylaria arbuscula]